MDDIDLAMEEAAEAARLSSLLPQLQAAAEGEGGGRRSSTAAGAMAALESADVSACHLPCMQQLHYCHTI